MNEPSQSPQEPASAAERAAKQRKAIAEAERDATKARMEGLKALIPDLSTVKDSTLENKEGSAAFSTFLSFGALELIADVIKTRIVGPLRDARVLVTGNADLASSDAIYRDVHTGLEGLTSSARSLLANLAEGGTKRSVMDFGASGVLGAVAAAVPGVLSLFTAKRTLITGKTTVDDLAAMAAVVSALNVDRNNDTLTLVLDDFRLVPEGRIYSALKDLNVARGRLVETKVRLSQEQEAAEAALVQERTRKPGLAKAPSDGDTPPSSQTPDEAGERSEAKQEVADEASLGISLIDTMLTGIDTFTAAIGKIPSGHRRSALAIAALHEQLHPLKKTAAAGGAPGAADSDVLPFSHVLLIKTQPGGSQQLNDNKPFFLDDKFSTLVEVSVSYVLIKTGSSEVVASGTVTRIARAYGTIGERPEFDLTEG